MNFRGWFEPKRVPVMDNTGELREVAPEHHDAAMQNQLRNQFQDTARTPVVSQPKEIKLLDGWEKGLDGSYTFVKTFTKHGVDSIIESVYKGKILQNHASLKVFHYSKDTSGLSGLLEKEQILTARSASLTIEDSELPEVIKALSETRKRIKELKKSECAHENSELLLEDTYHAEPDSEEWNSWAEGFMRQCIVEVDKINGNHKSKPDTHNQNEGEENEAEQTEQK